MLLAHLPGEDEQPTLFGGSLSKACPVKGSSRKETFLLLLTLYAHLHTSRCLPKLAQQACSSTFFSPWRSSRLPRPFSPSRRLSRPLASTNVPLAMPSYLDPKARRATGL